MITACHRPRSLQEALKLIGRPSPITLPLGGGTVLAHYRGESIEVVDLQSLGLNQITKHGNTLELGATSTLQQLIESPETPDSIKSALRLEAPLNLRNAATVAGALMECDGRSGLAATLLALDARVKFTRSNSDAVGIGEMLALRGPFRRGTIITSIEIALAPRSEFDYVARTPVDRPIVCVALAQWPSGRTRLALGGYGAGPLLAMDGTTSDGLETAAANAFHEATDPWGSAEYRMSVAATLARRCLTRLIH